MLQNGKLDKRIIRCKGGQKSLAPWIYVVKSDGKLQPFDEVRHGHPDFMKNVIL